MSESIAQFKKLENQSWKLKKNICEGMKMFQKYQLAVWLSIRNFYSHLKKVKGFWSHCRALAPISQKIVNSKLGRTTVFTISDRFIKLTDMRHLWLQITDWVGAVVNRKSLKTNIEWWGIMLFHHFWKLTTCKYHYQNKMYLPLRCVWFSNRLTHCNFCIIISHIYKTDISFVLMSLLKRNYWL